MKTMKWVFLTFVVALFGFVGELKAAPVEKKKGAKPSYLLKTKEPAGVRYQRTVNRAQQRHITKETLRRVRRNAARTVRHHP